MRLAASRRGQSSIGLRRVGLLGIVGGQVAERGIGQHVLLDPSSHRDRPPAGDANKPRVGRLAWPETGTGSRTGRRRRARAAAGPILAGGTRTVEQQLEILDPDLDVAGHRLAVQAEVVRCRAEQHVRHLVFSRGHGQLVFMALHPRPAVRPLKSCAIRRVSDQDPGPIHLRAASPIAARGFPAAPRGAQKDAAAGSAWRAAIAAAACGTGASPRRPGCRETAADGACPRGRRSEPRAAVSERAERQQEFGCRRQVRPIAAETA